MQSNFHLIDKDSKIIGPRSQNSYSEDLNPDPIQVGFLITVSLSLDLLCIGY